MSEHDDNMAPGPDGSRKGRNTTFSAGIFHESEGSESGSRQSDDPREITGGSAVVDPEIDGFRQPTAMFDKGEFLGELADLVDGAPDTRARVEAESKPPMGCRLIIVAGPDVGLEWSFKVDEIIIGRDEDCRLVLSDIAVSRRHARIRLEGEHFVLTDLSSGNGTFLNGVRIQEEALSPGDEIVVGERTLRFVELNEAPVTSAAQPVRAGTQSPAVSEIPSVDEFEPLLRDAKVEPAAAGHREPEAADGEVPESDDSPIVPGRALKRLVSAVLVALAVAGLALVGWGVYERYLAGETPAERALRVKREFLQGIELVKQLRCGDASVLFRRVLRAEPTHARAPGYLEHCEEQLAHWEHVAAARELAASRRYVEAIDRLKKVPADSDYAGQAARDRQVYARSIAYALLEEAGTVFEASDIDKALELVDRAIELAPDLSDARSLRRQIADAGAQPTRRAPRRPKFIVPEPMRRSIELYREGKISAAIDAAEAIGGDRYLEWRERMAAVKKLFEKAAVVHRRKRADELIRIGPEALALDRQIAGGEGRIRRRLQKYYADGLFLKGIDALQSSDDVSAFELLSRAVKAQPNHKLAQTRLAELRGKARELYYEGYILKDDDKEATRRIFRRLTQMTDPSSPYHKLASDWLRDN